MSEVMHHKWWGWGVEGIAFTHDNKPRFAPFVLEKVAIDLSEPGGKPPAFDDITVPASLLGDGDADRLRGIVGDHHVTTDDLERVVHTYGKGLRDLVRVRAGDLPRVPDVVVYPANEEEVRAVVDMVDERDAVLIPYGGGSNISGSLTPQAGEKRLIISLDLGRMNRVLEIDENSGLARIQAGVLGPDMEDQLGAAGWTTGHQPDSFKHSTLGGWIATRSSGMQSDKYGDIADITRGLRLVRPGKVVELRPLPATSSGPSVREMILGSEGRLGVITEAWVNVHRLPENREVIAYLFPNWAAGLEAMRQISISDATPSITRVSDAPETAFSLSTQKESTSLASKVGPMLFDLLAKRGWDLDKVCLSYIGYEGGSALVRSNKSIVGKIVSKNGGIRLGKGPGDLYDQKKFDTPYIRDFLLDRGAVGDVSETAAPWDRLGEVYHRAMRAAKGAFAEIGVQGFVMCHLSHSYHSGACLYFTFAFRPADVNGEAAPTGAMLDQYDVVKSAIQQAFMDSGATLSHHHGVGVDHAPWLEQDLSEGGVDLMVGLLSSADPKRNLNPGTLIPPHREW
ncbi:FAD-binding protein [Pseudactinotalea sp. HY160]|uniref:FAD-binding oxidoreductase n=1 Tax=Pseudactinotalea sp. HY160 TaxID=2654490 RepID=UPI00128D255D|nr:FAD-binding oxidoreductase [Pseudactinotalea sp. HY160]MPV49157.1 FAD-binding protein [Pseudactinotalea sp. HY160]